MTYGNSKAMKEYDLEFGAICDLARVDHAVIRYIDRTPSDKDEEDYSAYEAQGHVTNVSGRTLDNLVIDVSYFDGSNSFLGLNKSGLLDVDNLDPNGTMPFSIDLEIPDGTTRCVLNVSAKALTGFWARCFLGAKG